jgi:hypothetical protein
MTKYRIGNPPDLTIDPISSFFREKRINAPDTIATFRPMMLSNGQFDR